MNIGRNSILRERARQIKVEGYTPEHDDIHDHNQLYLGAECYHYAGDLGRYILSTEVPAKVIPPPDHWPFEVEAWKPGLNSRRNFEKAGAMYLAEIERLERARTKHIDYAAKCHQYVNICEDKINALLSPFVRAFSSKAEEAYQNSANKGFHESDTRSDIENGNRLMLIVGEVGEAHEALRHGNPPDNHIPEFLGTEAELADVIIRCFDLAETNGWRLAEAVEAKMAYNASRPYKHNKKF